MAGEEDGFLQRWSRRKQQAARVAPAAEKPDPAAEEARKAEAEALEKRRLAEEEAARAELLARLPRLEDLAAESDFRVFMHPLVPPALRSAALARMWTLDPTIRDFVGPARDYAWDWNVPGGVPGGGPAPSLAEIEETLRKLTARLDREEGPAEAPSRVEVAAPPPPAAPLAAAIEPGDSPSAPAAPAPDPPEDKPVESASRAPDEGQEPRRRHGGAMPA